MNKDMQSLLYHLYHLSVPHHGNNHRARIFHTSVLSYIIIAFLSLQLVFPIVRTTNPLILGFATNIHTENLLENTNQERIKNGLKPLALNSTLSAAAQKKANHMFTYGYWAHTAPDGTTPWDFILGEGYKYTYAGENLARDFDDSNGVVQAWMNSPSHRENLLRADYEEIGFGVVNGNLNGSETTLVVQMFGTKRPSYVARETAPNVVQAAEEVPQIQSPSPVAQPEVQYVEPTVPVLEPTVELAQKQVDSSQEILQMAPVQGTAEQPLINQRELERTIAIVITGILLIILVIDGFFIWRHKVIRIAGHNLAHFIFLFTMLGIIILGTSGAIL